LETDPKYPDKINLVSVGARGYSVLSREPAKNTLPIESPGESTETANKARFQYHYTENHKCSSGAGENVLKIAARFGTQIEEADRLALAADQSIPITARCSVFAKSEMTHYANQGKAIGDLFNGFFSSMAQNTAALLSRNRVDGPVYLIGGLTRIQSFVNAFAEKLNQEIQLPENHLTFEALGAAKLAADHINNSSDLSLPENPEDLFKIREKRFTVLKPASDAKKNVTFMDQSRPAPDLAHQPTVLGLDLGSTGAKAVLTSLETGEPLLDVYDTTRGNPVDAARRLVSTILEKVRPDVRAVGLTGSGREAVSTLARTVFPDPAQICVLNEIVAHATSAIKCDPDNGKDMSIIEIGGQDAKYIRVSQGRIIESDMNKACSAGTGSFLEEQAAVYDIHDIEQFVKMASKAQRPPDLGQMCTVYIAESGADALKEGFTLGDIFAGF
ncbi:MAG: hypothetical protein GY850_28780, partial [bacterium]|nr:hypothetical protein [bacterium]